MPVNARQQDEERVCGGEKNFLSGNGSKRGVSRECALLTHTISDCDESSKLDDDCRKQLEQTS